MTYADWSARPASVNDAECAEIVMRWERSGRWWVKDTMSMAPAEDVVLASAWSPTINRNDLATVVEEVERRGRAVRLSDFLRGEVWRGKCDAEPWEYEIAMLCAAPSLVAWACCESCRGGAS